MVETTLRYAQVAVLAALMTAAGAAAQAPPASASPPPSPSAPALEASLVRTGLYEITGGGGNTLLRLSAAGLVVVDGKSGGTYRPLMSQIRKLNRLSDLPVRVLVLTNHRDDHSGNAAQFAAAGVALLVQKNAAPRLPPAPEATAGKAPAPTVTFDGEYRLHIGGVEVDVYHFGNAVTDGDAVVHFPDLKVIAVGDLYTVGAPTPDLAAGGSLAHWASVLAQVLQLDFTTAVPSTGPSVTRAELAAFQARLATLVARADALVRQGVPKAALPAQLRTDDLGWHVAFTPDELDRFYAELAGTH